MPRLTVVWKINLLVLGGLTVLLGASVTFGLLQTEALGEQKVRLALTGAGIAASLVLDPPLVASLTPEGVAEPPYQAAEAALQRLARAFDLSDLYVIRPVSGNPESWEFVFDTADGPFGESAGPEGGFSVYEEPPDELLQAWKGQESVVTAQPYTDEYGTFRSAFLVLTEGGTPQAVIGTDFDLIQLTNARSQQQTLSLVLAVAGIALIGLLAWVLVRMIDVPLTQVSRRFTSLAEGRDDFSVPLVVRSHDELGDLAEGFNAFVNKLGTLVTDLRRGVGEAGQIQVLLQRNSEETSVTLSQTRRSLEALTSSAAVLESSIEEVLASLVEITSQGTEMDALARSQQETTDQAARDHGALDQEAADLRSQSHAVGRALADLDRESAENTARMEEELNLLRQLNGAVEAVTGIVATLVNTAESTGLLAMNASIEAAHAGVQGRGFAVIAQRMRLQAETSRADADRIGATLNRMVDLIREAAQASLESVKGAAATHARIEASLELVAGLTASGDHLEDYCRRNREAVGALRKASQGVAAAAGAVAAGTVQITASTRSLREVSATVRAGVETIFSGTTHMTAVVGDIREVAHRLTEVSQSLEANLHRIRTS